MLKTKPELYEVTGAQNNHIWLEVLEGEDQGLRVSVPVHSSEYDDEIQEQILQFEPDEVYKLTLVSEKESPPHWRVHEIHSQKECQAKKMVY